MHAFSALDVRLLERRDRAQRYKRNLIGRGFAPLLGNRHVFPRLLDCASSRLAGQTAVALHPRWAQAYFGQSLIVRVPLTAIAHYLADWIVLGQRRFHVSDYFLVSGQLNPVLRNVPALPILRETRELLDANWDFRQTRSYAVMHQRMKGGKPLTRQQLRLDSESSIAAYFMRFKRLHDSIAEHGVLPNATASAQFGVPGDREVGVAMNSDGALVKLPGGQHRLALAIALQVETLPVEIRMIHVDILASFRQSHASLPAFSISKLLAYSAERRELPD